MKLKRKLGPERYRAVAYLRSAGGTARNRHVLAQQMLTGNGYRSVRLAYAALNRAIDAGHIRIDPATSRIEVAQ